MEKETIPTCVDCGTQNCKYKDRTYPDFCPTENLKEEDRQWALERYDEGRNREIMIASAEVEYEGYCQWTRVQEIMEFARKIGAHRIGIANCIGLIREARIFARILRANGFEAYSVICKVAGQPKTSMGIPAQCESIGAAMCNPILQARLLNEAHTDLNVVIGLCVGHDSLFYKYSDAYVTTLVTKLLAEKGKFDCFLHFSPALASIYPSALRDCGRWMDRWIKLTEISLIRLNITCVRFSEVCTSDNRKS